MAHTASPVPAGPPDGLSERQIFTIFSGLLLGLFLAAVDQTVVSVALPTIVSELGGIDQLTWVAIASLLTATASTPLYGKISDLFGRRVVFQFAVVAFVAGAILAGLSRSMFQLVVFRGLQGVGGGGLMVMPFAIVGDLLAPRQRGRYMGYFTAVFAVAGVAGPLIGGFIVDHLHWRWIFFINLPLGAVAFAVISSVLHLPFARQRRKIDYPGAALLVGAVTLLVLVSVWAGGTFAWGSPQIIGLGAVGVGLLGLFLLQERRAAEPLLPLRLFGSPVVAVAVSISFLTGTTLFGALIFLPLFLQAVSGVSATNSGLLLAPMMGGLTLASVVAGRMTTRTGRYKQWVVLGAALAVATMALLARIDPSTTRLTVAILMVTMGLAIGMLLPILNLAAQNAVPFADLGVATTTVTFTRSLGGLFGMTAFGAVMVARLESGLTALTARLDLPVGVDARSLARSVSQIRSLDEPLRTGVVSSLSDAIASVFAAAVPLAVAALILSWLLKELPLREIAPVSMTPKESPKDGALGLRRKAAEEGATE
jgi:EmrB/QacA subfamily drug resistance transporter